MEPLTRTPKVRHILLANIKHLPEKASLEQLLTANKKIL
jgi:hypothetical protein